MICSVHLDSHIRLWDARAGDKPSDVLENIHNKQITSVSLAPDRKTVLTCSRDNTLKFVDLRMNQTLQTFQHPGYRTETNWGRACISPDGSMVVGGSSNGDLYIWDALSGSIKTVLEHHQRAINCVDWSPVAGLVSGDRNGQISLWK
jgi:autophagy-related protein 16-1